MKKISRREAGKILIASSATLLAPKPDWAITASAEEEASNYWADLQLWYAKPAEEWTEALPVGNGRLGAMIFGGTGQDRVQLNEETVWTGGPYDPNVPVLPDVLPEIRRLIFDGKYLEANDLFGRKVMGHAVDQMSYQSLGNLWLTFPGHGTATDYRRSLSLDEAIARVSYESGGVRFLREIFSSPVDQVIVIRLTASKPNSISFTAKISGGKRTECSGTDYYMSDSAPPDSLILRGHNSWDQGVEGQVEYRALVKTLAEGGTTITGYQSLNVTGADAVTLLLSAATNFVNCKNASGNPEAAALSYLNQATQKSYDDLRKAHITEHQRLFRRVSLNLGPSKVQDLSTDERIKNFAATGDRHLISVFFQYGRYLLITSSRPGTQPANLQGIWNQDMNPWWGSKYTTNINLQMNYWPAEVCNLPECAEPLIEMIREIARLGVKTAQIMYGARGWVLHQNTDLWLATAPMDGPTWGTFSTGGAWLCSHLWEHYEFGGDRNYLEQIYPILKGSAEFFLDTLVEHPQYKWLVTCPSTSPENFPKRPGNERYLDETTGIYLPGTTICAGSTIDTEILRNLFGHCIEASKILDLDASFATQLSTALRRLPPLQVGKHGQLQEWLEDWDYIEPHHRHLSNLWGLYPGNHISPRTTPQFAEASKQSILMRGDGGLSFSMAWKVNLWARLLDSERANAQLKKLIAEALFPNLFSRDGKALQVDSNEGGTAAIAEMLLQSQWDEIHLLPALPKDWRNGSARGLRARGGFEVDLDWRDGSLVKAAVRSQLGHECKVRTSKKVSVKSPGGTVQVNRPELEVVKFGTRAGGTYFLSAG